MNYSMKDAEGHSINVQFNGGHPRYNGHAFIETDDMGVYVSTEEAPNLCRAIYTAANLEWPTTPDLGPLREALLDLRARWDANGTTVEEITYLMKVAEDMEIIPPVKPDPMREVKEALQAMADDKCRSTAERQRAVRALEALS